MSPCSWHNVHGLEVRFAFVSPKKGTRRHTLQPSMGKTCTLDDACMPGKTATVYHERPRSKHISIPSIPVPAISFSLLSRGSPCHLLAL